MMSTALSAPLGWGDVSISGPRLAAGMTYAKLDGDREEVDADLRLDLLATGNTGEVDVAGLDKALGALDSLEELLGEPKE